MELKYKKRFHDVYDEAKDEQMFRELLYVMKVIRENPADREMSEAEWEAAGETAIHAIHYISSFEFYFC